MNIVVVFFPDRVSGMMMMMVVYWSITSLQHHSAQAAAPWMERTRCHYKFSDSFSYCGLRCATTHFYPHTFKSSTYTTGPGEPVTLTSSQKPTLHSPSLPHPLAGTLILVRGREGSSKTFQPHIATTQNVRAAIGRLHMHIISCRRLHVSPSC